MQEYSKNLLAQRLGKYELLEKIAVGGMAELFKAKVTGEGGFEKLVAIKTILPHLSSDQELISMFIDEARLAALLNHQNIVQIYDFGKEGDTYFIAMEYLQGWDLKAVLKKTVRAIPVEFALYIASRICAGLDYSHNMKDLHGDALDLIHRDISPQNIFITGCGEVKILDFGIAKVASKNSLTRVGVLKGKVSYMSPEQAAGKEIDRRSDIFSTGVLLYEMLSGVKMFHGDTLAVLQQVRNVDFEPLELVVPGLSPDVYAIVQRSLERDPAERYQSCSEMLAGLEGFFKNSSVRPGAESLAKFLLDQFGESSSAIKNGIAPLVLSEKDSRSDRPGETGVESSEKTETVIDHEMVHNSHNPASKVMGLRFGQFTGPLLSLALVAALFAMLMYVPRYLAGKQELGRDVHKAFVPKSERAVPIPQVGAKETPDLAKQQKELSSEHNPLVVGGAEPNNFQPQVGTPESDQQESSENPARLRARDLLRRVTSIATDQPEKATKILEEIIRLDPGNAMAYFGLGNIQIHLKIYPKAVWFYERAADLDPTYPDTFFNLGCLYGDMKDYPKSEQMFVRTAALSPSYLDEVYFCLAMAQEAQGKKEESIKSLQQALEINPSNQDALGYMEKSTLESKDERKPSSRLMRHPQSRSSGIPLLDSISRRISRFMDWQ